VQVDKLLEDGTLGLLLHGTSVVGFCSAEAEAFGWAVGDQIVEINSQRVAVFDEFLDHFMAAQEEGFPIDFSVLRREADDPDESKHAEGALEDFFSATNFLDLAGQMQQKFGAMPAFAEDNGPQTSALPADDGDGQCFHSESITENPYIQALRKRRSELFRSAEGWSNDAESLAAKLATQRSDALATLLKRRQETPRIKSALPLCDAGSGSAGDLPPPLQWPVGLACGARPCGSHEAMTYEIQPTPRPDVETEACQWEPVEARRAW